MIFAGTPRDLTKTACLASGIATFCLVFVALQDPAIGQKPATPTVAAAAKLAPKVAAAEPAAVQALPQSGIPAQPATRPSAEEAAHTAALDAALAPLLAYAPGQEDLARIKEAIDAITAGNYARGKELEGQITDPVGRKLVRWYTLRSDALLAPSTEIEEFRRTHPDWPEQSILRQRAEEALLTRTSDAAAIFAFFEHSPPQTGAGFAALAAANLAQGKTAKARELASKSWRDHDFGLRVEEYVAGGFGNLLSEADHKYRINRLLMKEFRWTKDRAERVAIARRTMRYLSETEQKKINARIAVYQRDKGARQAIISLPADAMKDWGVYFSVTQLARRAGSDAEEATAQADAPAKAEGQDLAKSKEAWKLLLAAPTDAALIVSPDDWFLERRASAYGALKAGQPKTAYDLASNHGPLSANPQKEAEFLSGWLALRYLNNAKAAEKHFLAMRKAADGPISKSSAEYWLGRTYAKLGDKAKAETHLRNAIPYFDTFYGQLARQTLDANSSLLRIGAPQAPTDAERTRFLARDAVKAIIVARRAGAEPLVKTFLASLRYHLSGHGELVMIAHLSAVLGDTQAALRTGKAAIIKGHNLVYYAYPTSAFPAYQPLRPPPEAAFLMGIARQESEFNTLTLSGAGAKGVLQVMTVTANHVCRDYKIKCNIPKLMSDPSYNTTMASAYIGDRMAEFKGSYVMTLAGYNAGPGRVRQWVKEFGDPRSRNIDPVDWIERIPFEETREYVKKVLANVQVYRSRLGQDSNALQIMTDLYRAREAGAAPIRYLSPNDAQTPAQQTPDGEPRNSATNAAVRPANDGN